MEHTFREDLPFARFASMTRRNLSAQGVEQSFHFGSPLSLGHLVAVAQGWRTAVRRGCLGGIRFARELADLLVLERVMMCARHI